MTPSSIDKSAGEIVSKTIENGQNPTYEVLERPFGTKKKMRVVVMGAGVSGLNFFKKAEERMENIDIICYEKNDDIGGTVCREISIHRRIHILKSPLVARKPVRRLRL
jgi:hypothetical protein